MKTERKAITIVKKKLYKAQNMLRYYAKAKLKDERRPDIALHIDYSSALKETRQEVEFLSKLLRDLENN